MASLRFTLVVAAAMLAVSLHCCSLLGVEGANYAHATYYGGTDASGTNGGSCGYTNLISLGYGTDSAALSAALYNDGKSCGACYRIQCSGDAACLGTGVTVTATNYCPQGSFGGWCDAPNVHFDLSYPAFSKIAQVAAGHVSVTYTKVSCVKSGGIKYIMNGHTYFINMLVYNVGGSGDVISVKIKGTTSGWISLTRGWGQNWQTATVLDGQTLSIAVTTSDGATVTNSNVAESDWQYGQTFQGALNF